MGALVALMPVISGVASVAGGIMSATQASQQARIQQQQTELQMRAEDVNARIQKSAINDELLRTLSRNNAVAAASGIQSSGSVAAAQDAAQRQAAQELSIAGINTDLTKSALQTKADAYGNRATTTLAGSLFDTVSMGSSFYKSYKGTK